MTFVTPNKSYLLKFYWEESSVPYRNLQGWQYIFFYKSYSFSCCLSIEEKLNPDNVSNLILGWDSCRKNKDKKWGEK